MIGSENRLLSELTRRFLHNAECTLALLDESHTRRFFMGRYESR
jgi:hypothetical protein